MDFQEFLAKHNACQEDKSWVEGKTAEQAWGQCPKAAWMLWLLSHVVREQELRQEVVRAAVDIARTALAHTKDPRAHDCIAAVDHWLAGEPADLRAAATAAWDAAWIAKTTKAAARAAWAAWAAAKSALATVWTAAWAEAAAEAALAADNAQSTVQAQHADIVRKHLPWALVRPLFERAMKE